MPTKELAKQMDDLELEFKFVEYLIDVIYQLPPGHPYHERTLEALHTHRLKMSKAYGELRPKLLQRLFSK